MDLNSRLILVGGVSTRGSNAQTITSKGVLEDGMEHHAQVLLALSICSALCLTTWILARRH
jgi:hypothetical protein